MLFLMTATGSRASS